MEKPTGKLRLDELKVDSFLTALSLANEDTVRGGATCDGSCPGDLVCP